MAVLLLILGIFMGSPSQARPHECLEVPRHNEFRDCAWFRNQRLYSVNLGKASSLKFAHLEIVDARGIRFKDMDMSHSVIKGSRIADSQFEGVNFSNTTFTAVRFDNVNFKDNDFTGARFVRCLFRKTDLESLQLKPEQIIDPIVISSGR